MKKNRGKFFVIDGTDGSGKATQTRELIGRLRKEKYRVRTIDFPQYENNFFGKMVGRYLSGEFGGANEVSPYLASILFAADRFETKEKIDKWLKEGCIVIADRYVSSNQIHQGGKIHSSKDRKVFLDWLEEMEFKVFKISRPDAIIYLDVPVEKTLSLLKNKSAKDRKTYLKGKKDIHEDSVEHLQDAKNSAIKLIRKNNNWIRINCLKNNQLESISAVHEMIWKKIVDLI